MSELELITALKAIFSVYINNYTIDVISRKKSTASSMDMTVAIVFQNGNITTDLLNDLIDFQIQNDRNSVSFETKKELGNLDYEIVIVNAEIFLLG